ncbi:MAG: DUF2835 family protein [Cellvibrionales bacterium]|jgi:hypothetical protein
MPQATFDLVLTPDQILLFYKARKNRVQVTARDGRTINLPWELLKPHVTRNGIQGSFVIHFDQNHKCERLSRLS